MSSCFSCAHWTTNMMIVWLLAFVCLAFLSKALGIRRNWQNRQEPIRHPIILVPGDGGTQIWATIDKKVVPHYLCKKKIDKLFDLWLNLEYLAPLAIDCWVDNMRLEYNSTTRTTQNADGVTTQILDWGNTSSVEWLDPSRISVSMYFSAMVEAAVAWGYKRGKNIRGAPYDFRKAPNEFGEFYENLTALIEDTYYANGNVPVVTVAHSMGNPTMLYFYQHKTQAWKDKFIRSHVAMSAPWGGSVKIMKLFASGYNFDHRWTGFFLPPLKMRIFQRTMTSSALLMPSAKLWLPNETLIQTPLRNYTVANYQQFFADLTFDNGWEMYLDTKDLVSEDPPNVEVHCLAGVGVPTALSYVYTAGRFPDYAPQAIDGDGDGTVPLRSAGICKEWRSKQRQPVVFKSYPKREHVGLIEDAEVIAYVKTIVMPTDR